MAADTPAKLADRIRRFTFDTFIKPRLVKAAVAQLRASEVHSAMGFKDRVPAIVKALEARQFADEYGLRILERHGQPVSAGTTWTFAYAEDEAAAGRQPALSEAHRKALAWFQVHAGEVVSWSTLHDFEPPLGSAPKAIYRPAGWRHAISVKIIPGGPYPDELPETPQAGSSFRYHEERPANTDPAKHFTNLGLANAMRDRVPVGVIRQVKPKPNPQYEVIGLGLPFGWEDGFFSLRLLEAGDTVLGASTPVPEPVSTPDEPDPISNDDARRRVARSIIARRGQAKFRKMLMKAYGETCCISGCDVSAVLEAAHIRPYLGDHTNVVSNGLLMRADLHTLFDLGLLRIDPKDRRVVLDEALQGSEYKRFHGVALARPIAQRDAPSVDNLEYAWFAATVQEAEIS
ncbi:HNH endonuclease [Brevundimonas faecalis]|uniref:HNH endonuclease n=1 Tax=Brevundimonas faecalis TaxID=947378 RepID=UPI0036190053